MSDKLAVIVLGNRQAGKSKTWNTLFQKTVKTGSSQRELEFNRCERTWVFLVSGSPEERDLYVGDIIADKDARIVLCSLQYRDTVEESLQYFRDNGFQLYVQWLNPGYSGGSQQEDSLGLIPKLLGRGATIAIANGKSPTEPRVREIRNFIYGWAKPRGLVNENPGWW